MTAPDSRPVLRPTAVADLDWVVAIEGDEANALWITRWPRSLHEGALASPDVRHMVIEAEGERAGYVILRGLAGPDAAIELLRIVVAQPGRGIGRAVLRLVKRMAFEELRAHRLWLDVVTTNEAARALYRSEGFVEEGVLREAGRRPHGFVSLVLMSMLEHEYRAAASG